MFTDEHDIERALSATFAVQPSEGFERRVLEAASKQERGRGLPWARLGAAAGVVLAAGLWVLSAGTTPPATEATVTRAEAPVPTVDPRVMPEPAVSAVGGEIRPEAGAREIRLSRSLEVTPTSPEPDVLVPANQLALINAFAREINGGRVELPEEVEVAELLRLLTVPEMTVQPIAIATVEAGDRGPGSKGLQQ